MLGLDFIFSVFCFPPMALQSGDEDEIEHLQHAVTPACFRDVGPNQVRYLLCLTLLFQGKGVFLEWYHQYRRVVLKS